MDVGMSELHGHYVPKGYLRFFTADEEQINYIKKKDNSVSHTNIRNVCSINGLYSLAPETVQKTEGTNVNAIENDFFSDSFEPYFCGLIRQLHEIKEYSLKQNHKVCIPDSDKPIIAFCLAVQYFRHPVIQEQLAKLATLSFTQMLEVFKRLVANIEHDKRYEELTISVVTDKALLQFTHTFGDDAFMNRVVSALANNFYWSFLCDIGNGFITSDKPVTVECFDPNAAWENVGLNMKSSIISFPLTPGLLLVLSEKETFPASINDDCIFKLATNEDVIYYNWVRYRLAERFVFGLDAEQALHNIIDYDSHQDNIDSYEYQA